MRQREGNKFSYFWKWQILIVKDNTSLNCNNICLWGGQDKNLKYYVGCSGWAYSSWTEFYPSTLNLDDYLAYYSRVFNFVEIDLDYLDQQLINIHKSQRKQQQQEKTSDSQGNSMYDLKNDNDNNSSYDNYINDPTGN